MKKIILLKLKHDNSLIMENDNKEMKKSHSSGLTR